MKRHLMIPVMLLLGAAPAFAQSEGSLSPEVQQKLDASRAHFREQMKPIVADLRATRESLRAELQKPQPDDGTLVRLEDRLGSDRQQMQTLRAQKQAELKRELTPQQYARLMLSRSHFGRRGNRR